jgi:hypothetical protein
MLVVVVVMLNILELIMKILPNYPTETSVPFLAFKSFAVPF